MTFNLKEQFREIAKSKVLSIPSIYDVSLDPISNRVGDIKIAYPINKSDSIVFEMPFLDQFTITIPDDIEINSKFGNYQEQYLSIDKNIIVRRRFQLLANEYQNSEYHEFYSFFKQIKEINRKSNIILNPR